MLRPRPLIEAAATSMASMLVPLITPTTVRRWVSMVLKVQIVARRAEIDKLGLFMNVVARVQ